MNPALRDRKKITVRDRKKITTTLLEGKFHSSIDDFPLQVETKLSAAEKSSKPERLSSSTTVTFNSLRSLTVRQASLLGGLAEVAMRRQR